MVQGEPWGLHGFFSTFRLACSNLDGYSSLYYVVSVSGFIWANCSLYQFFCTKRLAIHQVTCILSNHWIISVGNVFFRGFFQIIGPVVTAVNSLHLLYALPCTVSSLRFDQCALILTMNHVPTYRQLRYELHEKGYFQNHVPHLPILAINTWCIYYYSIILSLKSCSR